VRYRTARADWLLTRLAVPAAYSNMMFDSEQVVWLIVVAGLIGFLAVTGAALFRAAMDADLGRRRAQRVAAGAVAVVAAWATVAAILVDAGAFRRSSAAFQPWFAITVLSVFALLLLLSTAIPALSRVTRDPILLTRPQTVRVLGGVFLIAWAMGDLPAIFALPAGLGDIAVGIAAMLLLRTGRGLRGFHLLGLLDLVVAVSIGFLAGLGPRPFLDVTPSTAAVTRLPLVLIPVVLVPLAAALHVRALRRLRAAAPVVAVPA
jgi:hypothetical protein